MYSTASVSNKRKRETDKDRDDEKGGAEREQPSPLKKLEVSTSPAAWDSLSTALDAEKPPTKVRFMQLIEKYAEVARERDPASSPEHNASDYIQHVKTVLERWNASARTSAGRIENDDLARYDIDLDAAATRSDDIGASTTTTTTASLIAKWTSKESAQEHFTKHPTVLDNTYSNVEAYIAGALATKRAARHGYEQKSQGDKVHYIVLDPSTIKGDASKWRGAITIANSNGELVTHYELNDRSASQHGYGSVPAQMYVLEHGKKPSDEQLRDYMKGQQELFG